MLQVKIWFQNRRTKWKKMEYGTGITDSETNLSVDDVMTSKSHVDLCGATLDSLTSTPSSLSSGRHHAGQTPARHDQSESVQTSSDPDGKALDMSLEREVLPEVGCTVQSTYDRWENSDEDRNNDPDDGASLFHHKAVVDLSTSKTSSANIDHKSPEPRGHVTSDSDLEEFPDTARQCSSLLSSELFFTHQPRSPVYY